MPCDCENQPLEPTPCQPPTYSTRPDCTGTPCDDAYPAKCVNYKGPNLPTIGVTNNMMLKDLLVSLNKHLSESIITLDYTITVTPSQTTTVVEYINAEGNLASKIVTSTTSPQVITAQTTSPAIIKGTGTITHNS